MKVKKEKCERIWCDIHEEYCLRITNLNNGNYCHKYKDGREYWYNKNGEFHSDKEKPARIYPNGSKIWYKGGKKHRDGDKPAAIYSDGSKQWYKNDKLHRLDGPAITWECPKIPRNTLIVLYKFIRLPQEINVFDINELWFKNGQIHRDNGPAIIYHDGSKFWFKNGKIHRDNGPAIIQSGQPSEWYQNGNTIIRPFF